MEKLEDFIKKMAKVINESDKNYMFYEADDDFTDDVDDDSAIQDEDDPPSYDDVLAISKNPESPEDTMSREEYDALSDEEKQEIHQAAKEKKAMSNYDGKKDDDEGVVSKWNKEFEPLRQKEQEKRDQRAREKAKKLGFGGDEEFVDVKKTKHGVSIKDKKGEGGENAFMFICERVEKYGDKKKSGYKELVFNYDKNVQDWFVTNRDEITQDMEVVENRTETIQGESVEKLQEMMRERLKYFQDKYKIDLNDGWEIGSSSDSEDSQGKEDYDGDLEGFDDNEESGDSEKGNKKSKKDTNPVLEPPREIREIDEGAFGYMYYKVTGDKKVLPPEYQGKRGRPPEGTWDNKLNAIILEYIIYTSNAVLKGDGFSDILKKRFGES